MSNSGGSADKQKQDKDSLLIDYVERYWDAFFVDDFARALQVADQYYKRATEEQDKDRALELKAKILVKRGIFSEAHEEVQKIKSYSPLRLFLEFLLSADLKPIIGSFAEDIDSKVYKAQSLLFAKIYWGKSYIDSLNNSDDPDSLLEAVFNELIEIGDYDRAVLASAQALELIVQEQVLSQDLVRPVAKEQVDNLLLLAEKAKYLSTKAKIYLLKAKMFRDRQAAEDAEILFGRENNLNGLAEVYALYAMEFGEREYFDRALKLFVQLNNNLAQGFIYESLAASALLTGDIKDASMYFGKAQDKLKSVGTFEKLSLEIQKISLYAIKGSYSKIKTSITDLLKPEIPKLFRAQAAQILASTMLQVGDDVAEAKRLISMSSEYFDELGKYNQLLHTKNILFQILMFEGDLQQINQLGEEIIRLASRLGDEETKAAKYMDLAFAMIRISLEQGDFSDEKLFTATDYFKKAVDLYQSQGNFLGEADVYQSMGNMFANIGKLEEAFKAFNNAKRLYEAENASLQSAITDTLIGILMLDFTVLNEHTYQVAQKHFEQALVYFYKERLLDLTWKTAFYLADLNHKYYLLSESKNEISKNKAKNYYLEMLCSIEDYEKELSAVAQSGNLVGITIDGACAKAEAFMILIGEKQLSLKFHRHQKN